MIAATKFTPSVTPETWMTPYNGCRMSTLLTAARFQTLDEKFTNPSGKPYTKRQRTKLMKRLREEASKHRGVSAAQADGYSRDDALYAYRVVFPWGKAESFDPSPQQLREALTDGYFVSISGNVDDVPGRSPLDDAVNDVPHEIGLARFNAKRTHVLVYEPMRSDKPIWVKWEDVKRFASEFGPPYVAIKFKIGWATKAEATKRTYQQRLANVRLAKAEAEDEAERLAGKLAEAEYERKQLQTEYDALEADFAATEQLLQECHASGDRYNEALDHVADYIDTLREE